MKGPEAADSPPTDTELPTEPAVFISYSRKDLSFVRRLAGALLDQGVDAWVDWEDIPPTAKWMSEVFSGIEKAENFLFVITPDSLTSEICLKELEHAVGQGKRIVPLLRRDPAGKQVPGELASRNWIFFSDDDFEKAFETLRAALAVDLDWVRTHTRLLVRAHEWDAGGRQHSQLLRGSDLSAGEQWLTGGPSKEPRPTSLHTDYIVTSRRRASFRNRVVSAAVATALLITAVLAVIALAQRNEARAQARLALSRLLAAGAQATRDESLDRALLLAVQAGKVQDTAEARSSLVQTLLSAPKLTQFLPMGQAPVSLAFSPDGRLLAAGGNRGEIHLWKTGPRPQSAGVIEAGRKPVGALSFSPDGSLLASGSVGEVSLWDVPGRKAAGELQSPGKASAVNVVAFGPEGLVASGSQDGSVVLYRPGAAPAQRLEPGVIPVTGVAFTDEGAALVAGDAQGNVTRWDLTARPLQGESFFAGGGQPLDSSYSADMSRFAGATLGNPPYVTDVATGEFIADSFSGPRQISDTMAFGPGGNIVASGGENRILLWDAETGGVKTTLAGNPGKIEAIAFGPDGRALASASSQGSVLLWDLESASSLAGSIFVPGANPPSEIPNVIRGATFAAFSPDERLMAWTLASNDENKVVVWDVARGRELTRLPAENVVWMIFDGNTRLAALTFGSQRLLLWDVSSGRKVGSRAMTGAERKDFRGRGPERGRGVPWTAEDGHGKGASIGPNGSVGLWDTRRKVQSALISIPAAEQFASHLAFSPRGRWLAVANPGGGVALVDVDRASWEKTACRTAARKLTPREWRQFLGQWPADDVACAG